MQFIWKYIDDFVGKGLEWHVIVELMIYASATLIPMALPLAILLSSIMTFGSLGENYELVALKSAGISLQRIMLPLIILTTFISVLAFYFSNNVMPIVSLKFNALLYDVQNQKPQLTIKEGIFNIDIEGFSMKVEKKDNKKNIMYDILIYDHRNFTGNRRVTIAKSGTMNLSKDKKFLVMTLFDGSSYEESDDRNKKSYEKSYPHKREKFEEQRILINLSELGFKRTSENLFSSNCQMLTLRQLNYTIDSLKNNFTNSRNTFTSNLFKTTFFRKESEATGIAPNAGVVRGSLNKVVLKVQRKELDIKNSLLKHDTIKKYASGKINIDSLFTKIEEKQRTQILDYAANQARAAKSYITTSTEEMNFRLKNIKKHEIELHRKFTLSFACMVLFFIGAPLGAIIRKGGLGMPVVVSVLFFIIYYVISISGEKFVREEMLTAAQGMWLSSAILLPLGIFLTYKAANESAIMNPDAYFSYIKRVFRKRKNTQS